MSQLIKFPSNVNPSRVTMELRRVDETVYSPLSNVYQVLARGNAAWYWTYEFTDLSEDERDVVESFLMRAKGSVNTFRMKDPAQYNTRGAVSNWIDIFSETGAAFDSNAVNSETGINSYWVKRNNLYHSINDDGALNIRVRNNDDNWDLRWQGHGASGLVNSLVHGNVYLQRAKFFANEVAREVSLRVTSGGTTVRATHDVKSADQISLPHFVAGISEPSSTGMELYGKLTSMNAQYQVADYRLARCALMVNTENMLRRSNEFDHVAWSTSRISGVESGFSTDPRGGNNMWRLYVNSDTTNGVHELTQTISKTNSNAVYGASIYVNIGSGGITRVGVEIDDGVSYVRGNFNISASKATLSSFALSGNVSNFYGEAAQVFGNINRLFVCAHIGSLSVETFKFTIQNSDGSSVYTATDTTWVEIYGAQMHEFPFMGPYHETTGLEIDRINSESGSTMVIAGLDANTVIKAGTRFEVITQYHNSSTDLFEKSEFKRVTEDAIVNEERWAKIAFEPPLRNSPQEAREVQSVSYDGGLIHNAIVFDRPELTGRIVGGTIQYVEKPLQMSDVIFTVVEDMS